MHFTCLLFDGALIVRFFHAASLMLTVSVAYERRLAKTTVTVKLRRAAQGKLCWCLVRQLDPQMRAHPAELH